MSLAPLILTLIPQQAPQALPVEHVSPYAAWEMGPPTDPGFFPIGVWAQDPRHAERYARLGINTYVGLWKGPTEEQLAALSAAGMRVVCAQNEVALEHLDDPTIIAWMQIDEPDNRERGSRELRASTEKVQRYYERMRRRDPRRPVWLNLGQGVANDAFKGRGAKLTDYPDYAAACDILSFDLYPVANLNRDDGEDFLWLIAKGLRRLRSWGGEDKLLWSFLECTDIKGLGRKATPEQVRSEAWMSIVHGSRGIVWFVHQFEPEMDTVALFKDAAMMQAVRALNHEILEHAPVLNAPADPRVTAEQDPRRVGSMARVHAGSTWIFAVGMKNEATTATFRVEGLDAGTVEVLGEDRSLALADGAFADDFGPYEVHLYRLDRPE